MALDPKPLCFWWFKVQDCLVPGGVYLDIWLLKTADTALGIDVYKCMGSGYRIHIHIHVKMGGTSELEGLFMQVG